MTPRSETPRPTTVTSPKSLSISIFDQSGTASTANPAIAVVPEAATAAPVDRYARSIAPRGEAPPSRSAR